MSKPIKPISSRYYVNHFDAAACPACQSSNIASDSVDMDGSVGTANVQCVDCGSYWVDIVRVTSYSNLNEGMTKEELAAVVTKIAANKKSKF